jgi:hypothetical protein
LVDNLGAFDAVLQVRFVTSRATRQRLFQRDDLQAVARRLVETLPVATLDLAFCGACGRGLHGSLARFPRALCQACVERTTLEPGMEPGFIPDDPASAGPRYLGLRRCWTLPTASGCVTMLDPDYCQTLAHFIREHELESFAGMARSTSG